MCRRLGLRISVRTMPPFFSRPLILALLTGGLSGFCSLRADTQITRVWPEYRSAASFVRIEEYFGGSEKAPELILRSQAKRRDGFYFLARFKTSEALVGSVLVVEYFVPGEEEARVQFFTLDLPRGSRAVLAGLTGADWPGAKVEPTAWRLRLLGANGQELALEQSFLWALPPLPVSPSNSETPTSPDPSAAPSATT